MTYCVAIKTTSGLVMLSDTRTNAGVDNVSRFNKMFTWEQPGERVMAMMTSGNLSMTQGVVNDLNRTLNRARDGEEVETILNCHSMYRVAELVGQSLFTIRAQYLENRMEQEAAAYDAAILLAGQRQGGEMRLYMIYAAGNFIEATEDTPYLQIGEHKYGKPILDRVITPQTSISDAVKAACLSMDSTLRSNLSVGMPLDLVVIERDAYTVCTKRRIESDHDGFATLSTRWSESLRDSFLTLPDLYSSLSP